MAADPLPQVPIPGDATAPALSEPARILNTYIAPSKTFTDIRRNASWWGPWLLSSVVIVGFFLVVGQKIGFRKVAENQVQASARATERMDRLQPADREKAMEQQAKGTQYFTYANPIVILIFNLIIATILFATFTFGAGAQLSFKTAFAVVMYAGLPGVLKFLLAMVSVLGGANPDSFSLQNPVATNPGYFMNPLDSPFLFSLCSSLDIFLIWTLVLSSIGFSCVSKVKRGASFAIVFGWWLVFTLAGAGIAAAFS